MSIWIVLCEKLCAVVVVKLLFKKYVYISYIINTTMGVYSGET